MRGMIVIAALALAACAPAANQTGKQETTAEPASVGCTGHARSTWPIAGKQLSVTAFAEGPACQNAVATLVIREPNGDAALFEAYPAAHVMTLAGKDNPTALDAALLEWSDPAKSTMKTTDQLPAWPKGEDHPPGEFPFYPESDVDHEIYEGIRAKKLPMFCYVQGMESMSCLTYMEDRVVTIGVQSFPG